MFAVLLLSLPAAWPLLQPGWPDTHDQHYHLFRLIEFDQSFRQGILYPRWAPDLGLGHGAPLFNFVPPLAYYLAEAFHLLGADFVASINLSFFTAFILSPLGLYLWARKALDSRVAAVVAALAYNYSPYHFIDSYQRGALPEAISFVFYPLVLWAIHGLVEGKRSALPLGALALAGAVLAHNVTALPFLPIALLYLGGLLLLDRRGRSWAAACLLRAGLMFVLGLALSALYWLPALLEMPAITASTFLGEGGSLGKPLVEPTQVTQGSLTYDYGSMPYKIGLVQAVVVLIGLGATFIGGPALARRSRQALATSGALVFVLVGLTSTLAEPLWNSSELLVYIQFAWRLLLFVALFGALLTGAIAFFPERRVLGLPLGPVVAALAVAFLAYASLAQENRTTVPIAAEDLSPEVVLRWSFGWRTEGSIAEHQFTPRWVQNRPSGWNNNQDPSPTAEALPPIEKVELLEWSPLARRLVVQTSEATPLRLQTFYFPGWQAYLDGEAVPTFPSTEVGLITLDLPPGRHLVEVRYQDTLSHHLGLAASGLGFFFLLALLLRRRLAARLAWGGLGVALVVGAIGGVASLLANSAVEGAPVPLDVEASSMTRAIGYRLQPPEGGTPALTVELFWLVGSGLPRPLHLTLELRDAQGMVVVSQEAEPVYGTNPPGIWQPNEVVRDRYQLFLPPGLAGGQYRLDLIAGTSPRREIELGSVSLSSLPPPRPFQKAFTPRLFGGLLYLSDYLIEAEAGVSPLPGLQAVGWPGQRLAVTLFWKPKARPLENYSFFVHLLDTNFNLVAQRDQPAWDILVLSMGWLPGETIADRHLLSLPEDVPSGLLQVTAGVYDYGTVTRLPLDGEGSYLPLGWVKVRSPKALHHQPQHQLNQSWERGISLLGYDAPGPTQAGEPMNLTLYWRAEANVADDLTVFAHLVDAQGRLVAQHDSPPAGGRFPTWIWEEGDVIADVHPIELPRGLAPESYRLLVGLYDPSTGQRLLTAEGRDGVFLSQVTLSP